MCSGRWTGHPNAPPVRPTTSRLLPQAAGCGTGRERCGGGLCVSACASVSCLCVFSPAWPAAWTRNAASIARAASSPDSAPELLPLMGGGTGHLPAGSVQAGRGGRVDAAPSRRLSFHLGAGCSVLGSPPVRPGLHAAGAPVGSCWGAACRTSWDPPADTPGRPCRPVLSLRVLTVRACGPGAGERGAECGAELSEGLPAAPPSCPLGFPRSPANVVSHASSGLPRSAVYARL